MSVIAVNRPGRPVLVTTEGMNRLLLISPAVGVVGLAYVGFHGLGPADAHGIGAGLAAIYLGILSVAAPVVIARLVLQLGGASRSGAHGARASTTAVPGPPAVGWQLSAIFAGAAISLAGVVISTGLAESVEAGTHAHALALLTRTASVSLVAAGLTPAPGLVGWGVLLGLIDATRSSPEQRVQRAARFARVVWVPILGAGSAAAALLGSSLLALGGVLLAALTWTRSGHAADREAQLRRKKAAGREALVQFICAHTTGEVAVEAVRRTGTDAGWGSSDVPADLDDVSIVEEDGRIVGVIGPRERAEQGGRGGSTKSIMVPITSMVVLEPRSPAVELLPELARHGFALVSSPAGLGYVTPAVLGREVGAWLSRQETG